MSTPWPPADFESEGNPGAAAPELVPFPLPDLSADAFLPFWEAKRRAATRLSH